MTTELRTESSRYAIACGCAIITYRYRLCMIVKLGRVEFAVPLWMRAKKRRVICPKDVRPNFAWRQLHYDSCPLDMVAVGAYLADTNQLDKLDHA